MLIKPAHVVHGPVETRTYKMPPTLKEMLFERPAASSPDDFGFGGKPSEKEMQQDVKDFFVNAGVPFPIGTDLAYKPGTGEIIVRNTPGNLEYFEAILKELSVPMDELKRNIDEVRQKK